MIPSEIFIGPYRYTVEMVPKLCSDDNVRLSGQITYSQCVIKIDPDAATQKQIVTLFHEIMHGIANVYSFETFNNHEGDVDRLAHGLVDLLNRNPTLIGLFGEGE